MVALWLQADVYTYVHMHMFTSGGRQFKITSNDLIVVNKIPADIGSEIYLEKVYTYACMYTCILH